MRPQPDFLHEFVPGNSSRTLLLLHGTGGNERDLLPLGRELDPNASLLSPRGKILENGMPRFFRRLAEGVFDLEDLKTRTNELADFVSAAVRHYKLDADHIVGVGYSNGANIAASMLLLRPEIMHAAILFRAMVPLVPDNMPDAIICARLDRRWGSGSDYSNIRDPTSCRTSSSRRRRGDNSFFQCRPRPNEQ